MSAPNSSPTVENARVLEGTQLNPDVHRICLGLPSGWGPPDPGQFVQIDCHPRSCFALRRPFSISRFRSDARGAVIELVFAVVGEGTAFLSRRPVGAQVPLIGPLGRGFHRRPGRTPVLVGGGRGVAPLLFLADRLRSEFPEGSVAFGVRSESQLFPLGEVPYPVEIASEDGSIGTAGNVIDLLDRMRAKGSIRAESCALFACGPNPMLHALSDWAIRNQIPCQVSLETLFGCGFGICAGCAVPVHPGNERARDEFDRYRFACVDGPVFEADEVDWPEVRE